MDYELRQISATGPEYRQLLELRDTVLRRPLGMSVYRDDLSRDGEDLILAAIDRGTMIGCIMLKRVDAKTAKLRQMAVLDAYQGMGIGRALIAAAEALATGHGYKVAELHARETAVPFYLKLGYTAEGERFEEVGIPHLFMKKNLHEAGL